MSLSKPITARLRAFRLGCAAPLGLLIAGWASGAQAQGIATSAPITGEIERITINNPADHWSGGTMVVGGQNVIIPRNLLMDLPANRLTLQELFAQAPAACIAAGETGLAKGDSCNTSGTGGFATIAANRTSAGNTIAGDVFVQKGTEAVTGVITYIDYKDGYFRLNGDPASASSTGVMVRLNDPGARHTVQQGLGCPAGAAPLPDNCSPDPRFTLDPDNYTNVFGTGYPICIPSTVARPFPGLPASSNGLAALPAGTAQAAADGAGDVLCPIANRTSQPAADSRRFAPIRLGDSITAEGNFETINGVRFLSAHSTMMGSGITTSAAPDQPDYIFLDEVEIDAAGFQNQRARSLFIGFATLGPNPDVLLWSLHYDPQTNSAHEFPLGSVQGCDNAAGPATCGGQGLVGQGNLIWKIRHDVDFLVGARNRLDPCAHLKADTHVGFAGPSVCPNSPQPNPANKAENTDIAGMFSILSPIPHEIQARTGKKFESLKPGGTPLITLDISGNDAPNGQYLFPFGVNLGGIAFPEFVEIDLNALFTPFSFTGLPWTLDRRLSPAGCIDTTGDGVPDCEATPQPLDPYPFEGVTMDPRILAAVPQGPYNDPTFTASPLARTANRILSFVDGNVGNFNGNATVLAWPPVDPPFQPIAPTAHVSLSCLGSALGAPSSVNQAPAAVSQVFNTAENNTLSGTLVATDPNAGDILTFAVVQNVANGTLTLNPNGSFTFVPNAGFNGTDSFTFQVTDAGGLSSAVVTATINVVTVNNPPVAVDDTAPSATVNTPVTFPVTANDTDVDGLAPAVGGLNRAQAVSIVPGSLTGGTATPNADGSVTFSSATVGTFTFQYRIVDTAGATSNAATVAVTVDPVVGNVAPVAVNDTATTTAPAAVTVPVLANDTDANGDVLTVTGAGPATNGTVVVNADGTITYTPNAGFVGQDSFTYTVSDGALTATATVTVTVNAAPVDTITVTQAQFRVGNSEWRVAGTGSIPGNTVTIRLGSNGQIVGTAVVNAGAWTFRQRPAQVLPANPETVNVVSSGGGTATLPVTLR